MGINESKEKKKTQSETALQELSKDKNKSIHRMESSVSMDAVPVSPESCPVYTPVPPNKKSSNLMITEFVSQMLDKKFEPFKSDISEDDKELENKIPLYQNYMDFETAFGFHDAMILYHDDDKEDCKAFCDKIEENVVLSDKQKPSIISYARIATSCGNNFRALEFGIERCTFVMLYVTANFVKDKWTEYSSEACLMEAITNPNKRWCVVPVFTEDKSSKPYKIPLSINTLKGIRYSSEEEDFYLSSITTLFNDRISVKRNHQNQHLQQQMRWVLKFEAKARQEALEELKKKNQEKKEHEDFLRSVEQQRDRSEIQSSSTNFQIENFVNKFELSVAQKNEQLKQQSENGSKSLPVRPAVEERDDGSSVDPEDIVSDTPSTASNTYAPFGGRENFEHCSLAASSSVPPPVSNVALTECPQRSSGNPISCPLATAEDLAGENKSSADSVPHSVISNPPTPGSQSVIQPSASSESRSSGYKTNTNSQSKSVGKEKSYVGESASSIDHPLSEKSYSEVHHHHYYTNPPVYKIQAENVQIGSGNKLYNRTNHDNESDYEEQPGCDKDDYSSSDEQMMDEPMTFSSSHDSTLSQDGAQNTGPLNAQNREKKMLQEYGINEHKPISAMSINDPDQTRIKESENVRNGNNNNEDSEQTYLKEKL
ncbi:hypothetical protein LOTGIDRAFT_165792 [Lottia gigantea]|uniref:TIR domain-containing protein n=1 Tax=Lottia gigantea TaxID=225164 RepID=V4A0D6_LOTGI|nr:hypothetical protein LOTGIDRAFT_165792 [Lottia gigantea]ESO88350.1 hypothetical protein LOTGIDRAFT_165792 [Lottia gigantea]